ncbi:RNA polymerase sigma factor [Maledivibacter halophilus]|uniref:RNA polymerase sigma-70 factor, ECF subfamily n=1 Tax=Maledivibacter halophilus TaxID=36842 RepID=A0A1T5MMM8_9FIRM|nr:sigma-70 family RNA polymerase sigma factor [Maledivibacter halophilus]SKC89446.1 RNA polymerase sigma-70 factor, ECF subfamily [Maledivibacter halophilus]
MEVDNSLEISFDEIAKEYGDMVSSICRRMIQDPSMAEDAAQEVWIQIIKSINSFKGDSKLSTWIYSVTRRVIISYCTKEKKYTTRFLTNYFRNGKLEIPKDIDYDKVIWIKEMCDKCITGMLHCLDNEKRLIYLFKDMAQLEYKDIAFIFNKEEAAVRKMVSRIRHKLKNFLNDQCILYNPKGKCDCRMKKLVKEINLNKEYEKIRKIIGKVNFLLESEKILPKKNFWKNYI